MGIAHHVVDGSPHRVLEGHRHPPRKWRGESQNLIGRQAYTNRPNPYGPRARPRRSWLLRTKPQLIRPECLSDLMKYNAPGATAPALLKVGNISDGAIRPTQGVGNLSRRAPGGNTRRLTYLASIPLYGCAMREGVGANPNRKSPPRTLTGMYSDCVCHWSNRAINMFRTPLPQREMENQGKRRELCSAGGVVLKSRSENGSKTMGSKCGSFESQRGAFCCSNYYL